MRILKYIFLLIILGLLALFVFIATKDGKYSISESRIIALKTATLFEYVNDYKNWKDFFQFKSDSSSMQYTYPSNTSGVGSFFNWENGLNEGEIKTNYLKENDSIALKVNWNGNISESNITFKDTVGGTKISWNCNGKQDFSGKLVSFFNGGIENQLRTNFQKSLAKLAIILTKEINTYTISVDQVVSLNKIYYIKRKSNSKLEDFNLKLRKEIPLILQFVKDNEVASFGSPFAVFETYKQSNPVLKYALGLPLKEKIYTTPESEITVDSIMPHQALKITLKGDYSHTNEAWDKGLEYIKKNNLEINTARNYREVYTKSRTDVNNPSQWITEIYIPVGKAAEKTTTMPQTSPISNEELVE